MNSYLETKLSEIEFWTRYFSSKLFNAHRASIRSAAAQHVVKDDPIFDKYLEKDDDGSSIHPFWTTPRVHHLYMSWAELEPRRQRDDEVDLFVNLGATREDHDEVI